MKQFNFQIKKKVYNIDDVSVSKFNRTTATTKKKEKDKNKMIIIENTLND